MQPCQAFDRYSLISVIHFVLSETTNRADFPSFTETFTAEFLSKGIMHRKANRFIFRPAPTYNTSPSLHSEWIFVFLRLQNSSRWFVRTNLPPPDSNRPVLFAKALVVIMV